MAGPWSMCYVPCTSSTIQIPDQYNKHLNTGLVRYSNGQSCPVCKWSGFRMASEYRTKKSGIRMARLRDYHHVANCHSYVLPFEIRTGFQMAQLFENPTLKSPVFRCSVFRWLLYNILNFRSWHLPLTSSSSSRWSAVKRSTRSRKGSTWGAAECQWTSTSTFQSSPFYSSTSTWACSRYAFTIWHKQN